jgi:transcriptional regulator of acetoin/glycerol metabolism
MTHLSSVLNETQWNVSKSAEILGIDRSTLYDKIKRYDLRKPA